MTAETPETTSPHIIDVTITVATRNEPGTVLDGIREQLEPLRPLIVHSHVAIRETEAEVQVPAEVVELLGGRIFDDWHENCGEDGCNGGDRNQAEKVAREHLAAVLPAYRAMVLTEIALEDDRV